MVVPNVTTGFCKFDDRGSMEGKIIKFRLSLCLIKHNVIREYGGVTGARVVNLGCRWR
jgi:hypothetical protein